MDRQLTMDLRTIPSREFKYTPPHDADSWARIAREKEVIEEGCATLKMICAKLEAV